MTGSRPDNLEEYKIQASILLKLLRSANSGKALQAAARFQVLPHFVNVAPEQIANRKGEIKRKHALRVIAQENGRSSWQELKENFEREAKREAMRSRGTHISLYPQRCQGFLNEWCPTYEVARRHLQQMGGYLLPYKTQCFICTPEYIKTLGLHPDDPDWKRIGWDWVKPADRDAWERLNSKLKTIDSAYQEKSESRAERRLRSQENRRAFEKKFGKL